MSTQKFNWADDEDDDFDLTVWKATADISAPKTEDLGPLLPVDAEETQIEEFQTIFPHEHAPHDLPSIASPERESPLPRIVINTLPAPPSALFSPNPQLWNCPAPSAAWVRMGANERSGAPAYPEFSRSENRTLDWGRRKNYATNWKSARVMYKKEWKAGKVWRGSGLMWEVERQQEEEEEEEEENTREMGKWEVWRDCEDRRELEELRREVTELCEWDGEASDDQTLAPEDLSLLSSDDEEVREIVGVNVETEATKLGLISPTRPPTDDEVIELGYEDPPAPPTKAEATGLEFSSILGSAVTNTEEEKYTENDPKASPTKPLSASDKRFEATQCATNAAVYPPNPSVRARPMCSPDLKYMTPGSSFATHLSNVFTTGCFVFSSLPWKSVVVVAVGAIADVVFHIVQR